MSNEPPPFAAEAAPSIARLGIRAYARRRGVTHAAVRKAIEADRITAAVDDQGKIDPILADKLWEANTDPAQRRAPGPRAPDDDRQRALFGEETEEDRARRRETAESAFNYKRASTLREVFRARTMELNYRERKGELVNAAAVKRAQFDVARSVRDRLRQFVERCAGRLVLRPTEAEVAAILSQEVDDVLAELARTVK